MLHVDAREARQHPRWRRLTLRRAFSGLKEPPGHSRHQTQWHHNELLGHAYVHTVIDDHSRVAYAEIHNDETAATAVGVLRRAVSWFAARGVTVERVPSDNGGCCRSHLWKQACTELAVTHKRTRPYRPRTNGKFERFRRTMAAGWDFARHYQSEIARRAAGWLHTYNHHRQHSAIGRIVPSAG